MNARQICLFWALGIGSVCAQSDIKPEIRGTVTDPSLNIGVAGAEITLFEFLLDAEKTVVRTEVAKTSTDARGEFRFPLQHFGEYFVEIRKEGYSVPILGAVGGYPAAGARADVSRDRPTQDLRFLLSLPGEITGRVVDEDGNPAVGLRVALQKSDSTMAPVMEPRAITNQDGVFTTGKLSPGEYRVRIAPKAGDYETVTDKFSEDDLKIVDQDFDPAAAVLVPVSPGALSGAGTITARKTSYYRAHLSVTGADCAPKENWMFSAIPKAPPLSSRYIAVPCGNEFLVRNLKPGSYWFVFRSGKAGETGKWAMADLDITRGNVEVSLAMTPAADITGRFVAAEGATLPKLQRAQVMMRVRLGALLGWATLGPADADGQFVVKNLPLVPHDVSLPGLDRAFYIKEIRYNGVAVADGIVPLVPGNGPRNLEIVLDDKAATITGSVRDGDKPVSSPFIVAVKWPFNEGDVPVSGEGLKGDQAGRFQISGLAPGEYRVMAFSRVVRFTELSNQLMAQGEKVIVERGSLKDVALKLIDPSK